MESEFMRMQREATEQLRRMNEQAKAAPAQTEPKAQKPAPPIKAEKSLLGIDLDNDKLVLLGLLFLLYRDGGDPILMMALLYLLM